MSIQDQIKSQMKEAMKARDQRSLGVLRMINSKITERKTQKGFAGELNDALYEEVIGAYRKSLLKGKAQFDEAGERGVEQAAELQWEADFCARFLPQPLSEDEVRAAVQAAIEQTGAQGPKMMGRVMGVVMKAHKGRVDAPVVKRIALELLAE